MLIKLQRIRTLLGIRLDGSHITNSDKEHGCILPVFWHFWWGWIQNNWLKFDGRNFKTPYIQTGAGLVLSMLRKVYSENSNQKVDRIWKISSWIRKRTQTCLKPWKSMNKSAVFVEKAPLKKNYTLSTGTTGKMLWVEDTIHQRHQLVKMKVHLKREYLIWEYSHTDNLTGNKYFQLSKHSTAPTAVV